MAAAWASRERMNGLASVAVASTVEEVFKKSRRFGWEEDELFMGRWASLDLGQTIVKCEG